MTRDKSCKVDAIYSCLEGSRKVTATSQPTYEYSLCRKRMRECIEHTPIVYLDIKYCYYVNSFNGCNRDIIARCLKMDCSNIESCLLEHYMKRL